MIFEAWLETVGDRLDAFYALYIENFKNDYGKSCRSCQYYWLMLSGRHSHSGQGDRYAYMGDAITEHLPPSQQPLHGRWEPQEKHRLG